MHRMLVATLVTLIVAMTPAISTAELLGQPPQSCADYQWLQDRECVVQSWALKFRISPKVEAAGKFITVTVTVTFKGAISWDWSSIRDQFGMALGTPTKACDVPYGGEGYVARCRFKVRRWANGFRTYQLPFTTSFGQHAFSRDYFMVRKKGKRQRTIDVAIRKVKNIGSSSGGNQVFLHLYSPTGPLYVENGDRIRICNKRNNRIFYEPYRPGEIASNRTLRPGKCTTFKCVNNGDEILDLSILDRIHSQMQLPVYVLPD